MGFEIDKGAEKILETLTAKDMRLISSAAASGT